ncbi:hypothetical protein Fuma_03017 [Fuerstiella marisgermanici]|uniref:Uncharacterized protein n=1 Tax=Fuerstiella marisgermanici TaxID=1891926 RepID=A0A1P8WH92_9PLAN|nr:hypothetical protein Fuma_03017 [Fuerstiella marisgermanici]
MTATVHVKEQSGAGQWMGVSSVSATKRTGKAGATPDMHPRAPDPYDGGLALGSSRITMTDKHAESTSRL